MKNGDILDVKSPLMELYKLYSYIDDGKSLVLTLTDFSFWKVDIW